MRLRLAVWIWLAAMLGAVAVTVLVLPQLSAEMPVPLPAPLWLIGLASCLQSAVLLALCTWAGVALAPRLGLHAPAFEAAASRRPFLHELGPQLRPGLLVGAPSGLVLLLCTRLAPTEITALAGRFEPPILARLLYGGITEEVLMRWGVMTVLTWLLWRLFQRGGEVRPASVWIAIVVSSVVFGLGHLPVAKYLLGELTPSTLTWVIGANTWFGLLFGWLFWRRGLESAMVAHATTHLVNYLAGRVS